MEKLRNSFAFILATLVLLVTILSLLGIWEVIEIDYQRLLKKGFWSILALFVSSAIIMFIFSVIYRTPVNPPTPPPRDNIKS
ncbi:MAG: uncharacterized BrkB/YihY/UPF0761 family membrane protein [Flavobacteriales bacterium]|jgi:uncharacterized BrkB/YihY/UPF0761 family membrane protein